MGCDACRVSSIVEMKESCHPRGKAGEWARKWATENVVLPEEFSSVLWKTLPFPSFLVGADFGDKERVAFHVISMGK